MNKEETMDKPTFIYRDGMLADEEYIDWLKELKARYRQSQVKAAVKVNAAMLEFYWSLGRDFIQRKAESKWGSGFFNQLSLDMRAMFPEETGFSVTNLKYIKRWYAFYYEAITIRQQAVDELDTGNRQQPADEIRQQVVDEIGHQAGDIIVQQPVEELEMPDTFGVIPWGHHIYIFTKSKSLDEALFYIHKVATEGWSRALLEHHVAAHLFQSQGSAITNFEATLPVSQIEEAKQLLKKEYDLSFITVEAVKEEKDLENALAKNVTEFLLELGQGFAYLGRQKELRIDEETVFFPDLLFYHIPQRRYVIIELKAVKFMPEFAGKLNFYVTAADKLLRGKDDNPSVGLLICKTAKKTIVEWSLQDIQKPLGVATYQLQEVVDRTVAELELRKKQREELK